MEASPDYLTTGLRLPAARGGQWNELCARGMRVPGRGGGAGPGCCDILVSRYHDHMAKDIRQTTVRLPEDLADDAETVARVKGTSVNALIIDALKAEIERVRQDEDFTSRAKRLLERDRELLERLAR